MALKQDSKHSKAVRDAKEARQAPHTRNKITLEDHFKNGYILVVDDMQNMRKTIRNQLKVQGIANIVEAGDGDEALKLLRMNPEKYIFILLDWNMPRMAGIHVAREIRADKKIQDIPILMVTAEVLGEQIAQAAEIGVNGYIAKPFESKTLEAKMISILETRANPPIHVRLLKKGEGLMEEGKCREALKVYHEVVRFGDTARIHVNIGEALEEMGNGSEAKKSYLKATQLNPQFLKAHVVTANFHVKMGNNDMALASLEQANKISPNNPDRQTAVGEIYLGKGDKEKAQKAFNTAIKNDPDKSSEIAEIYLKADEAEEAERLFRKTLASNTGNVYIYNRLGIALRRQGKWEDAVSEYQKATLIDPSDEATHFNMAKALLEGGRNNDALNSFDKALKINRNFKEAKVELEKLEHGNTDGLDN